MDTLANQVLAIVSLGFALSVRAADIAWLDDADARGTESSPIDMYNAAKWNGTLPSSSHTPFFTDAAMTCVTNTCADAATTAVGNNVAINGDFTFLGDYYYTGSLLTPYAKSGLRDTVIVKKGNWSLNNFEPGHRPNVSLLFKDVSGDLTVRGSQDIGVALQSGSSVTVEKDSGVWTIPWGLYLGKAANTRTTVYWRGGNMDVASAADKFFILGSGQNSTNEFYMTGGTLTTHSWFLLGGNAATTEGRNYFEISSATVSQTERNGVFIGYKSGGHNELCVKAGGVFNAKSNITVGQDNSGRGILTVDGGEVNVPGNVTIANTPAESRVALKGGRLTAAQVKSPGNGDALLAFNGGTLRANSEGTLIAENAKLSVTVGANGGMIDANGKSVTIAEPLLEDAQSMGGDMTFKGGGSVSLAGGNTYTGKTTVEVGTALSTPAALAGDKLSFVIPAGLADGVYPVVSIFGDTVFAADVLDDAIKPEGAEFILSADKRTIYCIYGNVENSWTGGTSGALTDPDGWLLHRVPGNGETAVIGSAAAATLTIPEGSTFEPSAIVFPAGSAAVIIQGEGVIAGVSAVTNLSPVVQTIACSLAFADAYRVHCGSQAVNFSGGATASAPAADNTDNAASRALTGDIAFTQDWTATGSMTSCYTVPDGSRLYGKAITGELTDTTILRVEEGGYAEFESVLTGNSYGRVSVRGEMVVKGVWAIAGTANDFVGAEYDQNYSGVLRAGGIWKGDATHEMHRYVFVKIPSIFVGRDGFGSKTQDYFFQFEGNNTVSAADDFEMFGVERTGYEWDWGFCRYGNGNTTIDTRGYTVTWTGGAQGAGGIVKEGDGTLVMNPYGTSMTGAFTVNRGTLQLAKDGATGTGAVTVKEGAALGVSGILPIELGGDLVLEDGAVLAFELTQRTAVPQLAIAEGKSVTANGAVKVKVSATCPRPTGGEKQITTGGGFAGANVALAEGSPKWAKGVSVRDGNLFLGVKPQGAVIIIK